jgi:hypothetical protein
VPIARGMRKEGGTQMTVRPRSPQAEGKTQAELASLREAVMERFARKLDKYLPRKGELRKWTISEIEAELLKDVTQLARDVIEARIEVDPARVSKDSPRCPDCGRVLGGIAREQATNKQTIFGRIRYARTYGICRPCGVAFSPSGQRVALRQGLL